MRGADFRAHDCKTQLLPEGKRGQKGQLFKVYTSRKGAACSLHISCRNSLVNRCCGRRESTTQFREEKSLNYVLYLFCKPLPVKNRPMVCGGYSNRVLFLFWGMPRPMRLRRTSYPGVSDVSQSNICEDAHCLLQCCCCVSFLTARCFLAKAISREALCVGRQSIPDAC